MPIIGGHWAKQFDITVFKIRLLANELSWTTDKAKIDLEENARVLRFLSDRPRFLSIPTGEEKDSFVQSNTLETMAKEPTISKVAELTQDKIELLRANGFKALTEEELKSHYGRSVFFKLDGKDACFVLQIDEDNYCMLAPLLDEQSLRFMPKVSQADMQIAQSQMVKHALQHVEEKGWWDKFGAMIIVAIFCFIMFLGWSWWGAQSATETADKIIQQRYEACRLSGACRQLWIFNQTDYYFGNAPLGENQTLKRAPPELNPVGLVQNWLQTG